MLVVALVAAGTAHAGGRPDKDWKDWFGHFSGGWSLAEGTFGDIVDDDFYLNGGATYWPEAWAAGINLDLAWADYDLSGSAVRRLNDFLDDLPGQTDSISGGDVDVWSLSINALWGPKLDGAVGFYVLGGIGMDFLDGDLTTTGIIYYPPYCDPWYWWCYPGGYVPGDVVVASESTTEFAWNAGAGVTFELESSSQLYIEAKYHSANTDRESTDTIPIVIGFRW
jgi:opacity protein-like surface antigen